MPDKPTKFSIEVGSRLRTAIKALQDRDEGLLIGDIADAIGASNSMVSNWQKGLSVAQPEEMVAAHRKYGIPLDWLYAGDEELLPKWLLKRIEAERRPRPVEATAPTEKTKRRKAG